MSTNSTNKGYQKFLEEKKQREQEKLSKLGVKPTPIKAKPAAVQDSKFNQLIANAKARNQDNQEVVSDKLNPDFLKNSISKKKPKKLKNANPGDVEVMRDKIANRVSKNYAAGIVFTKYPKK